MVPHTQLPRVEYLLFTTGPVLCTCRYQVPRERGVFVELVSPNNTTTSEIINRIVDNRKAYEARNAKKVKSEEAYYGAKGAFVKEV